MFGSTLYVMTDEPTELREAAEALVAAAQQPPSLLQQKATLTGQAITNLAHAKRDLDEARKRGESDMMRYAQAFREAEQNMLRAIESHCDAIIASEVVPVANALDPTA